MLLSGGDWVVLTFRDTDISQNGLALTLKGSLVLSSIPCVIFVFLAPIISLSIHNNLLSKSVLPTSWPCSQKMKTQSFRWLFYFFINIKYSNKIHLTNALGQQPENKYSKLQIIHFGSLKMITQSF